MAKYTNLTASALLKTGPGQLKGFYVNSTSAGTIKIWDNTSAATTVIHNTITPAVGFHNLNDESFTIGCYITIGGTIDVTFQWD